MKFYLNHSYQYAIEQMLFAMFPGQKPTYPDQPPLPDEDSLISNLELTNALATARLSFTFNGTTYTSEFHRELTGDMTDIQRDRAIAHALKESFYLAGVQALDTPPSWGALSGVRPVKIPTQVLDKGGSLADARSEMVDVYHVDPFRADLAMDCAQASVKLKNQLLPNGVSLYVGIPFCPTRCSYCSFVSADVKRSLGLVEPFLDLLLLEIEETGRVLKQAKKVIETVYIGGGTPTTLDADQLNRLLVHLTKHLPILDGAEFTLEAGRVDTITQDKLDLLAPHHINRISINPQTMEEHVLRALGRTHSVQEIYDCYKMARASHNVEINMDLIAGLPQDTVEGFCRSLLAVADLEPENITVHTLALKRGSTITSSGIELTPAQAVSQMLDFAWKTLLERGYKPYYLYRQKYMQGGFENISWTKGDYPNRYNILMMEELQTVVSVGGGGITKLVNRDTGAVLRLNNAKYPHDYLRKPEKIMAQKQSLLTYWSDNSYH